MPKAANLFGYRTIAGALITIGYTALNGFDYREQVNQTLNLDVSIDRPFSFRNEFADQWYDLHNPELESYTMTVRFTTLRENFPLNIDDLETQQIVLYFAQISSRWT